MKPMLALPLAAALAALPAAARAHCDTLDGPLAVTARGALESGKVAPVLAWVRAADEPEIRAAFAKARSVRRLGPEARDLADRSFLETVVRVHRQGEGAPYTGLKPAGLDAGPAVTAADRAVRSGSTAELRELLLAAVRSGLGERFAALRARRPPADDAAAGREWVAAYVRFVHFAEAVHAAAAGDAHGAAEGHGAPGGADAHRDLAEAEGGHGR